MGVLLPHNLGEIITHHCPQRQVRPVVRSLVKHKMQSTYSCFAVNFCMTVEQQNNHIGSSPFAGHVQRSDIVLQEEQHLSIKGGLILHKCFESATIHGGNTYQKHSITSSSSLRLELIPHFERSVMCIFSTRLCVFDGLHFIFKGFHLFFCHPWFPCP